MSPSEPFRGRGSQHRHPAESKVGLARAYARKLLQNDAAALLDTLLYVGLWAAILMGGMGVSAFVIGLISRLPVTMDTETTIIVSACALAIVPLWFLRRRFLRDRKRAENQLTALIQADGMFEQGEPERDPFPPTQRTYLDLSEGGGWPAGEDLYYECLRCGDIIPSLPDKNLECACGNIAIDRDYGRFSAGDEQLVGAFLLEGEEAGDPGEV
jgi:hypothetical protein